jgi:hypothetical protein
VGKRGGLGSMTKIALGEAELSLSSLRVVWAKTRRRGWQGTTMTMMTGRVIMSLSLLSCCCC